MKVILKQDIKTLGKQGEVKDVSDGYAKNFLLPKKMAEVATQKSIEKVAKEKDKSQAQEKKTLELAKDKAKKIEAIKLIIKVKSSKGKLFGSVGKKEIAQKLNENKFNIKEEQIFIAEPIKTLGKKEIVIQIHPEVKVKIKISVEEEK